jgi:hypothetical protein
MLLRRSFGYYTASILAAIGLAAPQAFAGEGNSQCDFEIEVSALRAGSPTVTVGGTKDVTAKARIAKGTAATDTVVDTMLVVDASDGGVVIDSETVGPIRIGVGKGGKGGTVTLSIPRCNSGFIDFIATFSAVDSGGDPCEGTRRIIKECSR